MKEGYIFRPLETRVLEPHPDDATFFGGALKEMSSTGSRIRSIMLTDGNAQGIGEQRELEQKLMEPILGIEETHFVGRERGIRDSIAPQTPAQREHEVRRMTYAAAPLFRRAREAGRPVQRLVTWSKKGGTGHEQHKQGWRVAGRLAHAFPEVEEIVTVDMSSWQREQFLKQYGGEYTVSVPEVDVLETHFPLLLNATLLAAKIAAIETHESQMEQDGRRSIDRLTDERPPVEYVNMFIRQPNGLFASNHR